MSRRAYSAQDDATMRAMIAAGALSPEVAAALGRSRHAVLKRAEKLGLKWSRGAVHARRCATLRRHDQSPTRGAAVSAKWTPERRERQRALMAERKLWLLQDEAARKRMGKTAAKASWAKRYAWCPPYLLPEYRVLRSHGISAAEAKRSIQDTWRRDVGRALTAICAAMVDHVRAYNRTLEGQIARLQAGAALVQRPRLSRPIDQAGLIGCATGML